jgi:glycosyltransferase involved in cell wall biosynthesis
MRILVINWQDIRNPYAGGAEVHLHEIFSRIARRGHEVTLLTSMFPGGAPEEVLGGIRVVRRGSRNLFNLAVPSAYRALSRERRFDIVVDDLNKIPFFTPLYVSEPLYGIAHHLFGHSIFREADPLSAAYVYGAERLALPLYRRAGVPFMVVSPSTRSELRERGFRDEDLPLVYNCVDQTRFRLTGIPKNPTPLIGYFGRLKKYKSVDHIIRALERVKVAIPGTRLLIVGEGDDRARLERLARRLQPDGSVEFTGFVSEDRKVELLQRMWVKVNPSFKEGWGLTVVEANACGTPVVASDVPGLRDSIKDGETGVLYPYGNLAALAERVVRLLRDEPLRKQLSLNAREWARTFDWDVMAEKAEGLLAARALPLKER